MWLYFRFPLSLRWRHLPERRARRRPRHARRRHGRRFSPDLNILHRPDAVAARQQFGHWECDLMPFRKKFGKANVTSLVERVSRFAVFLRNNDRQSRPRCCHDNSLFGPATIDAGA